jgi:hypothetical protein
MSPDQGDDFNWVTAQAHCNATAVFERLRAGVRDDIQRRNGLLGRDDGWKFELHEEDGGFEASRVDESGFGGSRVAALVAFERAGRRINVRGDGVDVDFTAVVTLDGTGSCRLVVGEAMYSEWEVRRMALEQLFFEENEDPDE